MIHNEQISTHFDPLKLAQLADHDPEIIKGIIADFLELSPVYFNEMEVMMNLNNPVQINFAAHKLIAPFKFIGATKLAQYAERIEKATFHSEMSPKVNELFEILKTQYLQVVTELKEYSKNL